MYACSGGHVEVVKALLEAGANIEDANENGHTPLMEAASAGHVDVAQVRGARGTWYVCRRHVVDGCGGRGRGARWRRGTRMGM